MSFKKLSKKLTSLVFVAALAVALPTMAYAQTEGIATASSSTTGSGIIYNVNKTSTTYSSSSSAVRKTTESYSDASVTVRLGATTSCRVYVYIVDTYCYPQANSVEFSGTGTKAISYLSGHGEKGLNYRLAARINMGSATSTTNLEYSFTP